MPDKCLKYTINRNGRTNKNISALLKIFIFLVKSLFISELVPIRFYTFLSSITSLNVTTDKFINTVSWISYIAYPLKALHRYAKSNCKNEVWKKNDEISYCLVSLVSYDETRRHFSSAGEKSDKLNVFCTLAQASIS